MKVKSKAGKESQSFEDANLPIPDLTMDVRSFMSSLGNSPAETYLKDQAWRKFVSNETDSADLRYTRAVAKWLAQEEVNAETNVRLAFTPEDYHILPRVHYGDFMSFWCSLVESTIGAVPPPESLLGGFSGGASTSRNRKVSAPALKFTGQAHVTARARFLATTTMAGEAPLWAAISPPGEYLVERESNILFTVPKDTTIDRCACKEPDVNMYLQKGLGNQIRRALRRVGVNLNDQSINRALAREGSRSGELATLDLSSASDSVTWELVFQVMPVCWFTLLDSTRSETTVIGGEEHVNEMFSSMGNGFTFELESLIFWSLARTVAYFRGISGRVSVYGDDIIVPTALAEDLVDCLSYFGFKVNPEKSFWTGDFRESCGGHYMNGCDVTPFYVRRPINSLVEAINLANAIRRWSGRDDPAVLDPTLLPLWEYVASFVPGHLRGGVTLGSNAQLVDLSVPKFYLSPISEKKDTGIGGYLHWLSSTWERESGPVNRQGPTTLRLVFPFWDSSDMLIPVWMGTRSYHFDTPVGREVETSERTETKTMYRLRRTRKRLDTVAVTPWFTPGDPDSCWL